jgi:biopolymer transport protein ExbB
MLNTILLQLNDSMTDSLANAQDALQEYDEFSLIELLMKGGWVMVPIVLLSIIAIYIFIERYRTIQKATKEDPNFMNHIRDFVSSGNIDAAKQLCSTTTTPIARMIEKGISRIGKPLRDIEAAVENVGKLEVYRLEKNVATIATIAGAAPMIGFLGTVTGMIRAFYNMSKAGNNIDPGVLAGGIYEAMVTTAAGLVVGIVAYIGYNILVSMIDKVIYKLEARAVAFLDLLHEPAK